MEKVIRCGHEWAIRLTEQLDEAQLDAIYSQVLNEVFGIGVHGVWLNKRFAPELDPTHVLGSPILNETELQQAFMRASTMPDNQFFIHFKSRIVLPIRHKNVLLGLLVVQSTQTLSNTLLVVLYYLSTVYINQLATLHHARLDPLTELLNRQTFEQKVMQIMAGEGFLPPREGQPKRMWFLAMLDIDHFKAVNDNYGHIIGDEVILMVAQLLKQNFRAEDYVFRYGGEEFACLFQAANERSAVSTLERLRLVIANHRFPQVGQVTLSMGFVEVKDFCQVTALVHQADLALYESKHQGRNRITPYSALSHAPTTFDDNDVELF